MKNKMPNVKKSMPDLTRTKGCERSVGAKIEELVKVCDKYELDELKKRLTEVLDNPETTISKKKNYEYKMFMDRIYSKKNMMEFIKNIYLASAAMSIT